LQSARFAYSLAGIDFEPCGYPLIKTDILTDVQVKKAKPRETPYKLTDGLGMYLLVQPSGSRLWRFRYRFGGKEKLLALGWYPDRTLAQARKDRKSARDLLHDGIDPAARRKEGKRDARVRAATAFEAVAREWHTKQLDRWTENHAGYVLRRFEADVFPKLGARPISEIQPPEILDVLHTVERRGAREIAHRLSQSIGAVFRYAIGGGRATSDPTRDLRGQLKPVNHERYAALTAKELPEFLRRLESNEARLYLQTRLALKLLVLTFVRTGELIGARWNEFDLDGAEWRIPPERMKMREGHIVPLSKQAIAILLQLRALNPDRDLVFPNQARPDAPMSGNTMLFALGRMGYRRKATGHGFRATASTILNEHGFSSDAIERQLAHAERNKSRAAYNRALYLPERRKMMQHWADYLDGIAAGASVSGARLHVAA